MREFQGPLRNLGPSRGASRLVLAALVVLLGAVAPAAAAGSEPGAGGAPPAPGTRGTPTVGASGDFNGTFVAGQLPASGVVLANFSVLGVPLFTNLSAEGYVKRQATVEGGQIQVTGTAVALTVSDAATAFLTLRIADNITVAIVPAAGATWSADSQSSLRLVAGPAEGLLWSECPGGRLEIDAGAATLTIFNAVRGCSLHFRVETEQDVLPGQEFSAAVTAGQVGAEISVSTVEEGAVSTVEAYSDVEVAVAVGASRIVVAVSAPSGVGRSFVVYLPSAHLHDPSGVVATLDGRHMGAASSAIDALNASDDAGAAELFVVVAGNVSAIVLSVPSFSVHIFDVALASPASVGGALPLSPATAAAVVGVGLATSGLAGAALFMRPRKKEE